MEQTRQPIQIWQYGRATALRTSLLFWGRVLCGFVCRHQRLETPCCLPSLGLSNKNLRHVVTCTPVRAASCVFRSAAARVSNVEHCGDALLVDEIGNEPNVPVISEVIRDAGYTGTAKCVL
jgi:hypothetical protein